MLRYLTFIFVVCALLSCRKEEPAAEKSALRLSVPHAVNVRQIHFLDEQLGFACGGNRFEEGYIWKTTDGGQSWTSFSAPDDFSFYAVHFTDANTGYAGGEFLRLFTTNDGGDSWNERLWAPDELPFHEVHRPAIRQFRFFGANEGYFVGGEQFEVGSIYHTTDAGQSWSFDTVRHELRGLDFFDAQNGLACGYGYMAKFGNAQTGFQQLDLGGDFFVQVRYLSEISVLAVGNAGGVYASADGGDTWDEVQSPLGNSRHFTDLEVSGDGAVVLAVGQNGLVLESADGGKSWQQFDIGTEDHLHCVEFHHRTAWIGSKEGMIYQLEF